MKEGLILKQEFKKIGITSTRLAELIGLHWTSISRKINKNQFTQLDKLNFGNVLESLGGDPSKVWSDWTNIKHQFSNKILEPETIELTPGVKFIEGSILSKPIGSIHIPNFGNLDYWIRVLSLDIESDQFLSGQVFGIEKINDMDGLIYGAMYYVYSLDFEGIRIIEKGSTSNSVLLKPLNKKLQPHMYSLIKKLDIYRVKGVISWL